MRAVRIRSRFSLLRKQFPGGVFETFNFLGMTPLLSREYRPPFTLKLTMRRWRWRGTAENLKARWTRREFYSDWKNPTYFICSVEIHKFWFSVTNWNVIFYVFLRKSHLKLSLPKSTRFAHVPGQKAKVVASTEILNSGQSTTLHVQMYIDLLPKENLSPSTRPDRGYPSNARESAANFDVSHSSVHPSFSVLSNVSVV